MTCALEARGFTLTYPGAKQHVFAPLDFAIEPGEVVALRGDSGAGKSSLLLCACGLIGPPHKASGFAGTPAGSIEAEIAGEILLFGRPPRAYTRIELTQTVGMVFQNPETQLFCGTAELEVAFGLENLCIPRDEMRVRVREIFDTAGIERSKAACPPQAWSGGQKQLLALAAVLALRPKLLLLDEALSQLDSESAQRMAGVLRKLKDAGQAMLFVDHDDARCGFAHREIWL